MATNISAPSPSSPSSVESVLCLTAEGMFQWKQHYLTPTVFVAKIVATTLLILSCPFTILLNGLVILAVRRKSYLQEERHVLLASLAGTDLLVGVVALPLLITSYMQHILGIGPICLIDTMVVQAMHFSILASLFHMVIISGERYIAIKHALRYTTLVTTGRLAAAVTVAWLLPALIVLGNTSLLLMYGIVSQGLIMKIGVRIFVPGSLLAISFCQGAVLLESRRHRQHIKAHQVSEAAAKELLKKDKAAITTTIIVTALFLCFGPPTLFYAVAMNIKNFPRSFFWVMVSVTDVCGTLNSLINPIIYCMRTQEFQRAIRELLHLRSSQVNVHIQPEATCRSRRQSRDGCTDSFHATKRTAWKDHSLGSRSCPSDVPYASHSTPDSPNWGTTSGFQRRRHRSAVFRTSSQWLRNPTMIAKAEDGMCQVYLVILSYSRISDEIKQDCPCV